MHKTTKTIVVVVVLALAVATAFSVPVYVVADGSGGTVFWNEEEAYLFLGGSHTGYHFRNYMLYAFAYIGSSFNVVPSPQDQTVSEIVMKVSPSGIEKHVIDYGEDGHAPLFLTPFDDGFYAMCPAGTLCKWAGECFRPATEEERRKHDGTNGLIMKSLNNRTINGWSAREVLRMPGDQFEVKIGKELVISARNRATDVRAYPWVTFDLNRSGQATQSLYNVDGTPRRVSRREYEGTFRKTK